MTKHSSAGRAISIALAIAFAVGPVIGFASASEGTSLPQVSSPRVLVGLTKAASVTLSSPAALTISSTGTPVSPAVPVILPAGTEVTLSVSGSGISWGFTPPGAGTQIGLSAGPVLVGYPVESQPASPDQAPPTPRPGTIVEVKRLQSPSLNVAGRSYRGSMLAIPVSGTLLLANVVDMEDYVKSTVGAEMPDDWPLESQKAQAIAVRTYAAYKVCLSKAGALKDCEAGFRTVIAADVMLWATDQVYRGLQEENPLSAEATAGTRGMVLAYNGAPAAAYFHSDAGGMTEESRFVWGGTVPYLQAVAEMPHESPYSLWTVRLAPQEFSAGMASIGIIPSALPDIITGYGPGRSGRWTGVSVTTSSGVRQTTANQFRNAFPQVRSMLFSSYSFGGGMATTGLVGAQMTQYVQSDGAVSQLKLGTAVVLGGDGSTCTPTGGAYATTGSAADVPQAYVLEGSGWGHGVGLSQYGAKAMALSGCGAAAILNLYYPGTTLEQWWP